MNTTNTEIDRKARRFLNAIEALLALKNELQQETDGPMHRVWITRITHFVDDLMDDASTKPRAEPPAIEPGSFWRRWSTSEMYQVWRQHAVTIQLRRVPVNEFINVTVEEFTREFIPWEGSDSAGQSEHARLRAIIDRYRVPLNSSNNRLRALIRDLEHALDEPRVPPKSEERDER